MLNKLIHGWDRMEGLAGASILIYADCRKSNYLVVLEHILNKLDNYNTITIVADGTFIVPASVKKHVKILHWDEVKNIHAIDAAIVLGKPKSIFFQALAGKPDLLFAAHSDAV